MKWFKSVGLPRSSPVHDGGIKNNLPSPRLGIRCGVP
jgi:hypothetical protein